MRSLTEALLYPGVGLLEATNIATGRGTDTPFERIGAPWINPAEFAAALNILAIPGVRFVPIYFTPRERQYAGTRCGGVQILVNELERIRSIAVGLGDCSGAAQAISRRSGSLRGSRVCSRIGRTYDDITSGRPLDEIMTRWEHEVAEFQKVRVRYLLY